MFEPKIKIRKALYEKLKIAAETVGTSSLEEFVEKIVEKEVDKILSKTSRAELSDTEVEDITAKLQGLGYLE